MKLWLVAFIIAAPGGIGLGLSADEVSYAAQFKLTVTKTQDELRAAQASKKETATIGEILAKEQAAFRSILEKFESVPDPSSLPSDDLLAVAEVYERKLRFGRTAELAKLVLQREPDNLEAKRIEFRSFLNLGRLEEAEMALLRADNESTGTHPYPRGHSALATRYEIARNWSKCRDHLRISIKQTLLGLHDLPQEFARLDRDLQMLVRCAKAHSAERELPAILGPTLENLNSYAMELRSLPTNVATLKEEGATYTTLMRITIILDSDATSSVFRAWLQAACRRLEISLGKKETSVLLQPIAAFASGNRKWCAARWNADPPEVEEFIAAVQANGARSVEQRQISERFLAFISTAGGPPVQPNRGLEAAGPKHGGPAD